MDAHQYTTRGYSITSRKLHLLRSWAERKICIWISTVRWGWSMKHRDRGCSSTHFWPTGGLIKPVVMTLPRLPVEKWLPLLMEIQLHQPSWRVTTKYLKWLVREVTSIILLHHLLMLPKLREEDFSRPMNSWDTKTWELAKTSRCIQVKKWSLLLSDLKVQNGLMLAKNWKASQKLLLVYQKPFLRSTLIKTLNGTQRYVGALISTKLSGWSTMEWKTRLQAMRCSSDLNLTWTKFNRINTLIQFPMDKPSIEIDIISQIIQIWKQIFYTL